VRERAEKVRPIAGQVNAKLELKSRRFARQLHRLYDFLSLLHAEPNFSVPIPIGRREVYAVKNHFDLGFVSHATT
jgi:hypothetical protein